jgi:parvulin-like peptidyl-prolyl isomerase
MSVKLRLGTLLLLVVAANVATAQQFSTVDRIMATVDTEPILLSDVMAEIGPQLNQLRQSGMSEEAFNQAVDEQINAMLIQAIESRILVREAQLAGVIVDEDDIEKELADWKALYDSNEEFLAELDRTGQTMSELREKVRHKILAGRIAYRKREEFRDSVEVSESDVAQYYADQKDQFGHSERVRLRQIFMEATPDSDRAVLKAQMEEIKRELDAGADFGAMAAAHSDLPGAEDGGVVGWVARGVYVVELEDAIFALSDGGISDVQETEGGFGIFMVESREEAGVKTLDEARAEIEPMLREQATMVLFAKWMEDLKKRSRVRIYN